MNDEKPKSPTKSEWQRFCHVCAHPLTKGMETCPECGAAIVDVAERLESALGDEAPKAKRIRRNKELRLVFDMYCSGFVMLVLIGSPLLMSRIYALVDSDMFEESGLGTWFMIWNVAVILAMFALIRMDRVYMRYLLDRLKK